MREREREREREIYGCIPVGPGLPTILSTNPPPSFFIQAALQAMLEEQSSLGSGGKITFDDFKLLMLRAGRDEDPAQQVRHKYI